MKLEQKKLVKAVLEEAGHTWGNGSHGEPPRVSVGWSSHRKLPRFQVCRLLDITAWKEQIISAVLKKQTEWLAANKKLSKSRLYAALEANGDTHHGILVKTGIKEIDDIGLYAEFWTVYLRGQIHLAEAFEPGRFRMSVMQCWNVGNYAAARSDGHEWIIRWGEASDHLFLEHWSFPDFYNEKKLCRSAAKREYFKAVRADLEAGITEGWELCSYGSQGVTLFKKAV